MLVLNNQKVCRVITGHAYILKILKHYYTVSIGRQLVRTVLMNVLSLSLTFFTGCASPESIPVTVLENSLFVNKYLLNKIACIV